MACQRRPTSLRLRGSATAVGASQGVGIGCGDGFCDRLGSARGQTVHRRVPTAATASAGSAGACLPGDRERLIDDGRGVAGRQFHQDDAGTLKEGRVGSASSVDRKRADLRAERCGCESYADRQVAPASSEAGQLCVTEYGSVATMLSAAMATAEAFDNHGAAAARGLPCVLGTEIGSSPKVTPVGARPVLDGSRRYA